jgi:hypothetical protein
MNEPNSTLSQPQRCGLLPLLAAIAGFNAYSTSAITWGLPDDSAHPNVGALMVKVGEARFPICSGTLVEKVKIDDYQWQGVYLTAGHCIAALNDWINAEQDPITLADNVKVNFDPDPDNHPEKDVDVKAMDLEFVLRPNFAAWDDMGLLVLVVKEDTLPDPADLAAPGFLDGKTQRELQRSQLMAVGYGASILFPPAEVVYDDKRQFSTPKYLSLVGEGIKLQVNGLAGNSGVCFGDSGGPLFWEDPDTGKETIVAICHGGYGQFNSTVVHYRVDTEKAHDFVESPVEAP